MAIYEYLCRVCDTRFEARRPMSDAAAPIECPDGHPETTRLVSVFASVGPVSGQVARPRRPRRPASAGQAAPAPVAEPPVPDQFNLVVSDMEATVAFYRRLGLTIPDTDQIWQSHHRNANLPGGIKLDFDSATFARHWDKGWRGGMGVLGFKVDSRDEVDEKYADLTGAGYIGQQEPYDALWGARYAVVEDPDGNPVGIMSPIDPERRSDPGFP